jgi:hypothetical protein
MPYIIKKQQSGFKVCKKSNPSKCFSNKPLTKKKAIKQLAAIKMNESAYDAEVALILSLLK